MIGVIIRADHRPVPVAAKQECNFTFSQFLFGYFSLSGNCTSFGIAVVHQDIECIHQRIELRIIDQFRGIFAQRTDECIRIFPLFIDLCKIVGGQRPVLFHYTGGRFHAAGFELLDQLFE